MRTYSTIVLSLLSCVVPLPCCSGASLQTLDLVLNGSADPPGDRLDFSVQFAPDETELEVSVRGYRISGQRNEVVTPLGDADGGKDLARKVLSRNADSLLKRGAIVIPYTAFNVTPGTHQVAFEFILKINGRVVFVRPTPLSEVTVSDETRREISVSETTYTDSVVKRSGLARVASERESGEPQKSEMKATSIATPVREARTEVRSVPVEIPGEFLRTPVPVNPASKVVAEPGVSENDVQTVARKWWRPLSEVESDGERRIWFATNRAPAAGKENEFSAKPGGQVHYGSCVVNIPVQNHRKGALETPSWWSRLDPAKHFVINKTESFDKAEFCQQIGDGDVLLFIHGYYNTFDDVIFRTAQLHHDLDFGGQSVAFSWPSAGSLSEYESDQKNADASVDALVDTISTITSTFKVSNGRRPRLHIIAHSMGNRILLQSLYTIGQSSSNNSQESPFGQIVLAAPDVGAIMFNNLSPYAVSLSDQVTYYFCHTDTALNASRKINQYEPVGLLPYFDDGLSTINANGVGTSFIGHGYYASSRDVLRDIELMLKYGNAPPERMPPLALETKVFGHRCWAFTETKTVKKK